jgi:hypothetical protein
MSGAAKRSDSIAATACGTWLAELEKALALAGFRVVSWSRLNEAETQQKLSTQAAAQQLGADVVFMLNSLEATEIKGGASAGASFKYFEANNRGTRGAPVALEENDRAYFREFVKARGGEEKADAVTALASALDTTAILTRPGSPGEGAGEAMWFYRRIITHPVSSRRSERFLFGHDMVPNAQWYPIQVEAPAVQQVVALPTVATEDTMKTEVAAGVQDPYAAEKLDLVREIAKDFVARFRGVAPGN